MDERTKNVPRSRHQRFKTKTPHGSCCFMCGYQDVLNAIYDSLVCFGSPKAFVSCKKNHYPNSLYSQGSFANPFVLLLRPQRCLARKPYYNNLFRGPFAVKGESLKSHEKDIDRLSLAFNAVCLPTVSSHTSSAHLRSRKGREKEERKWKEETRKNVARSMETLQGDWSTWCFASFAALSRIFRGSFGKCGCPPANFL